jgi:hypothetical protein
MRSAGRARGIDSVEVALALLDAVHAERREEFPKWVNLVLESLNGALGEDHESWTRFLISASLNPLRKPPSLSIPAVQALIEAFREHEYFRANPPKSDFVRDAISEALALADDDRARAVYFRLLIDILGPKDRAAAIETFVSKD